MSFVELVGISVFVSPSSGVRYTSNSSSSDFSSSLSILSSSYSSVVSLTSGDGVGIRSRTWMVLAVAGLRCPPLAAPVCLGVTFGFASA